MGKLLRVIYSATFCRSRQERRMLSHSHTQWKFSLHHSPLLKYAFQKATADSYMLRHELLRILLWYGQRTATVQLPVGLPISMLHTQRCEKVRVAHAIVRTNPPLIRCRCCPFTAFVCTQMWHNFHKHMNALTRFVRHCSTFSYPTECVLQSKTVALDDSGCISFCCVPLLIIAMMVMRKSTCNGTMNVHEKKIVCWYQKCIIVQSGFTREHQPTTTSTRRHL